MAINYFGMDIYRPDVAGNITTAKSYLLQKITRPKICEDRIKSGN